MQNYETPPQMGNGYVESPLPCPFLSGEGTTLRAALSRPFSLWAWLALALLVAPRPAGLRRLDAPELVPVRELDARFPESARQSGGLSGGNRSSNEQRGMRFV